MIKNNNIRKIIGILLIIIAIIISINDNIKKIKEQKEVNTKIARYISLTKIKDNQNKIKTSTKKNEDNYIAILEIPSINLKRGLLSPDNELNDVNYNIEVIETSEMPDVKFSNLILASHSGTSNVAYFNRLDELAINSLIYLYYNGYKYSYKLTDYYQVIKNGTIDIKRNNKMTSLTLITCDKSDDTKQLVYIAYLINKETY